MLNRMLLKLASDVVAANERQLKLAAVPAGGGMAPPPDPSTGGGMMPPGGAPPMDPAMMGGMPPGGMPPGGAPPMDPAMMGGMAPPMDPSMMGGMPPAAPPPGGAAPPGGGMPPQKIDQKQLQQAMDYRLYNMQQQLSAIMNALNVKLDPGALITPPGSNIPVAEAALPGGPQDPASKQTQDPAAGAGQSSIPSISPLQGASPELATAGGGGEKQGRDILSMFRQHSVATNAAAALQLIQRVAK